MRVLAVVVNYRTAESTLAAALSLVPAMGGLGKIVVVDNDSQDGSFERLSREIRDRRLEGRIDVVASPMNGGFGYGNNVAIHRAYDSEDVPDYFYLLNPDALAEEDTVRTLVEFMDRSPEVGIAGTRIHGMDGEQHISAFRFPSPLSELERGLRLGVATRVLRKWVVAPERPRRTQEIDWVSGASVMLRREMLEAAGAFDEQFFLYFEETDLCFRARQAGFRTWYVHEASVRHEGSISTGMNDTTRRIPRYWFVSRYRFFRKNYGRAALLAANAAFGVGYGLFRIRRRIQRKPDHDPPHHLADFVRYNLIQTPQSDRLPEAP